MSERNNKIFKLADRYLGIIILLIISIFYNKRLFGGFARDSRQSVVVLKTGAIGDALLVGSAVSLIKENYPKSFVAFICTASNVEAVRGLLGIDKIIVINIRNLLKSFRELRTLGLFDLLLDFAPWARLNGIISCFIMSRYRIGFKTAGMYRHYIYDRSVEHSSKIHELDNYSNLLTAAGIEGKLPNPSFTINRARLTLPEIKLLTKSVVFHPFPGGAQKHLKFWPQNKWICLGRKILSEGYRVIISGGPDDFNMAKEMAEKIGVDATKPIAGSCDLNQTAYIIQKVGSLITVDTGVMHLGAAVGARVICLHGPTVSERWGAKGINVEVVKTSYKCAPCISLGFESKCKLGGCMEDISVDDVFKVFMKLK